jgi:transposase-like protein
MKDKLFYCNKCKKKTPHLKVGYRKPFEKQWYRCKICGEEQDK